MQTENKYDASSGESLTNHLLCCSFSSDPPPLISLYFSCLTPNLPRSALLLLIFLAPVLNSPHFLLTLVCSSNLLYLFTFLSTPSVLVSLIETHSIPICSPLTSQVLKSCAPTSSPHPRALQPWQCFPVSLILISTNYYFCI